MGCDIRCIRLADGAARTAYAAAMATAVIVDAVRTPLGRRNGQLAGLASVDLAGHVLDALVDAHTTSIPARSTT